MKQTNFFDISVPELGDRPDITHVSSAIMNLEDALAGTIEYMNASINNKVLTLTSATRTTKRTGYHTGLTCAFTSGAKIDVGGVTSIVVDNLPARPAELKFIIDVDDSAIATFDGTKFAFKHAPIPRSSAIDSSSEHYVATSRAVKTLNDNKAEKTIQIVAGNGLTGGGDLTSNKTINVVSADAGIIVNADNIKLNVVNAINSTDAIRPASANSAKTAYDRGTEGLNKANEAISLANSNNTAMDNKKVNRAGDTMTGNLILNKLLVMEDGQSIRFKKKDGSTNQWMLGTLDDKLFIGETTIPSVIRSSSNPTVKVGSAGETAIYHTGNKPTKADVGLSSVSNFPITSSVSDASNEKYATAGAVKQAYDRASSGINEANTKVSKSGDTMTGTLIANGGIDVTTDREIAFSKNTDYFKIGFKNTADSDTDSYGYFKTGDNGNEYFKFQGVNGASTSDWMSIKSSGVTATRFIGPLQGNADTSTKLATVRSINGTNFDGSGNITTANWGTARNLQVGNTAKSVNGGGNVTWSLSEIGAAPASHTHSYMADGGQYGTIKLTNWFRSVGNTGWYSETHGGGIMMQDSTWVRVHGSKAFLVSNQLAATGNITAYYSDERMKTNFRQIDSVLDKVCAIDVFNYEQSELATKVGYDEEGVTQIGFKAQDMKKHFPEFVKDAPINHSTDIPEECQEMFKEDPILTLDYGRMTTVLWKAIQEQNELINNMKERILSLEAR
ncbi:MAG: tail fiber domain-containing protein [Paraclostridium sp.]